jgi:Rrf2 family protein
MKLSRASSYALHALAHAARQPPGQVVTSEALAGAAGAPQAFLMRALKRLEFAGILRTARGPGGGYRLARPLEDITLLEVVDAVDGPVRGEVPADFATAGDGLDGRLARVCEGVAELVRGRLSKVKLSGLVKG